MVKIVNEAVASSSSPEPPKGAKAKDEDLSSSHFANARVDNEKCIGCGFCVVVCAEVFEIGEEGKAKVKEGADLKANEKCIKEAKEGCPVEAIED